MSIQSFMIYQNWTQYSLNCENHIIYFLRNFEIIFLNVRKYLSFDCETYIFRIHNWKYLFCNYNRTGRINTSTTIL